MTATTKATELAELEQLYASDPARYRRKILALMALGYGYLAAMAIAVVGFVGGGAVLFATGTLNVIHVDNFVRAGIPLVVVVGLMTRAIFVRVPRPEGVYLSGELRAAVLRFFEDVRVAANGPRIDHVVVDSRLNAAVQQMPRFGLFGRLDNYLILGAPLLALMNAREVRAVIAHEFGHLSHEHGRMGAAVYRLNHTLASAARAMTQQKKSHSGLLGISFRFLRWFSERFDRLTFALRRGQEYEADAVAARATSGDAMASALCRLHALDIPLDDFWRGIWQRSRSVAATADVFPFRDLHGTGLELEPRAAAAAVERALATQTDFHDTHPAIADRLRALAVGATTSFADRGGALDEIFGSTHVESLMREVDLRWQGDARPSWTKNHEQYREAENEKRSLEQRRDALDAGQLFRLARLSEDLDGRQAAIAMFGHLAERHPDNAAAQFHLARVRFYDDFTAAESGFYRAVELDPELVPEVEPFLKAGYERTNRAQDFARFTPHRERFAALRERANAEREAVKLDDELVAPGLSTEQLAALMTHLERYPEVRRLYLVEKKVAQFQHSRVFLLGFDVDTLHGNVEVKEEKWLARVSDDFSATFPFLTSPFAVILRRRSRWLARLAEIEGALVYTRSGGLPGRLWEGAKSLYGLLWVLAVAGLLLYGAYRWLLG